MSYEPDADVNTSLFASMSDKKLVFLAVIIIIGGFFGIQAMFGFQKCVIATPSRRKMPRRRLVGIGYRFQPFRISI
jgi:hypothetical protein